MNLLKKNWVWIIVAVLAIYLFYTMKKKKETEAKAVAMFNSLNSMSTTEKKGADYTNEKASLLKLVDNATTKEREILTDLLSGAITVFTAAQQEKDKEKAKEEFQKQISQMQTGLITKHGQDNVLKFKAKMDKYGFDI